MCSVSAQLRREDTDKCILTITYMLRFDFFTSETRWWTFITIDWQIQQHIPAAPYINNVTTYYYDVHFLSWVLLIMIVSNSSLLFVFVNVKCCTLFLYVNMLSTWVIGILGCRNKLNLTTFSSFHQLLTCSFSLSYLCGDSALIPIKCYKMRIWKCVTNFKLCY